MQTYSFYLTGYGSPLSAGISVQVDAKLGQVVFLGEEGRGRRYEKVSLERRNPATVVDGKVLEADAVKIKLQARDGNPEREFFVLSKPKNPQDKAVLVRVKSEGVYTKNTSGGWRTVVGAPETLISGYGAYGDAGRIGSWNDGLVVMRPGDVLQVTPSGGSKVTPWALFFNANGELACLPFAQWQAMTEATKLQAEAPQAEILFATMPLYHFERGEATEGEKLTQMQPSGMALILGSDARGRKQVIIPAIGFEAGERIPSAAVAKGSNGIVLTKTDKVDGSGKVLIRMNTKYSYSRGAAGTVAAHRGTPQLLAAGYFAQGDAGNIHQMADELWVIGPGDVLNVRVEGSYRYALYLQDGKPVTQIFKSWELDDARRDPAPYIAEGRCPTELVPRTWIGQVVELQNGRQEMIPFRPLLLTGLNPVVVDTEWDALVKPAYNTNTVYGSDVVWIKLRPDLKAEAPVQELESNVVTEFGDPPYVAGTQVVATIKQEVVSQSATRYSGAQDKRITTITIAETPATQVKVTKYEKGGETREDRITVGQVKADYVVPSYQAANLVVPAGFPDLLDGQYVVEFVSGRRGSGWSIRLVSEAVVTAEETTDFEIYLGQNASRDGSKVWIIDRVGNVIAEKYGDGRAKFLGIPVSALVIRYQTSNYGYSETETWEVYHRAETLTEAQLAKAQEIGAALQHKYFQGEGTGWEFGKVGVVRFSTPYHKAETNSDSEVLRALYAAFPINVAEYGQKVVKPHPDDYVDEDHPVIRRIEVSLEKAISAEESTLAVALAKARANIRN